MNPPPQSMNDGSIVALQSQQEDEADARSRNVYCASLPHNFTDEDLLTLARPFGHIISARAVPSKKSGRCKGYGFVLFESAASAARCIEELHGARVGGHRIQVRQAREEATIEEKIMSRRGVSEEEFDATYAQTRISTGSLPFVTPNTPGLSASNAFGAGAVTPVSHMPNARHFMQQSGFDLRAPTFVPAPVQPMGMVPQFGVPMMPAYGAMPQVAYAPPPPMPSGQVAPGPQQPYVVVVNAAPSHAPLFFPPTAAPQGMMMMAGTVPPSGSVPVQFAPHMQQRPSAWPSFQF